MKLTVDLAMSYDDYDRSIAEAIRDEILQQVRAMVKKEVKAVLEAKRDEVRKQVEAASETLTRNDLARIFYELSEKG